MSDTQNMQNNIDRIQTLYREWLDLYAELETAQKNWQKSQAIMRKLSHFYFNGKFTEYREKMENGTEIQTHTQGEYSVMSEDTLWNAFHDHQELAWGFLRHSVQILDPINQESPESEEWDCSAD